MIGQEMIPGSGITCYKVCAALFLLLSLANLLLTEDLDSLKNFFVGQHMDCFPRLLLSHIWDLKIVLV